MDLFCDIRRSHVLSRHDPVRNCGGHRVKMGYPSVEFDNAVAAVCQGFGSDDQVRGLNELLRRDPDARDEYLLRVELHSRLASGANRFMPVLPEKPEDSNARKKIPPDR